MRLIDANALREVVISFQYTPTSDENERCVRAIDSAPTVEMPVWVSVQDRLPEKYGSYLTLREGQLMPPQTRMAVRFWTGNKDGEYWRGAEAGSRIVGITHWRALPKPPEEVQK